jgi:hypothetical protein
MEGDKEVEEQQQQLTRFSLNFPSVDHFRVLQVFQRVLYTSFVPASFGGCLQVFLQVNNRSSRSTEVHAGRQQFLQEGSAGCQWFMQVDSSSCRWSVVHAGRQQFRSCRRVLQVVSGSCRSTAVPAGGSCRLSVVHAGRQQFLQEGPAGCQWRMQVDSSSCRWSVVHAGGWVPGGKSRCAKIIFKILHILFTYIASE